MKKINDINFIISEEIQTFIETNANIDINQLILNPPAAYKEIIKQIAEQILARQKAKNKLNHWLKKTNIIFPPAISIEQASSEQTAKYKQKIIKGKQLFDLSGGMGVDCIALSENFENTTYVEQNEWLCTVFQHNSQQFNDRIKIVNDFAENFIKKITKTANSAIFLDPARRDQDKNKVFKLEDCTPNLLALLPEIEEKVDYLLVKLSPLLDLQHLIKTVPNLSEIHIVSVKNDCKELLLFINFTKQSDLQTICVNLGTNQPDFKFEANKEKTTIPKFGQLKKYLYEPNVSILKAGAFKKIGTHFNLDKIAPNTHLYTSDTIISKFPGRVFEVIHDTVHKKDIQKYTDNKKINVITRNYPLSSNALKKKLNIKDGGNNFLIGLRDLDNKANLVVAERII